MIFLFLLAVQNIRVYNDGGQRFANELILWRHGCQQVLSGPCSVTSIEASDIRAGMWKDSTALLIFPGGADKVYHTQLQGDGNRQILEYVEGGGRVLGVCAGAYYFAKKIHFEGAPQQFPITEDRELGFFPGTACGPLIPYVSGSSTGAAIFHVHSPDSAFHAFYKGGCYFPYNPTYENCEWIAWVTHDGEKKYMVVGMQVKKGYVIASGVHPEVCPTYYPIIRADLAEVLGELKEIETKQGCYALLRMILARFGFACVSHVPTPEQAPQTRSAEGITHIFWGCPGILTKIFVKPGDKLQERQVIATVESMKMIIPIHSSCVGTVTFAEKVGTTLSADSVIVSVKT